MEKLFAIVCVMLAFGAFAAEQKHSWFDMDIGDIGTPSRIWPADGSNYEAHLCVVTNTSLGEYAADERCIRVHADDDAMSVLPEKAAEIGALRKNCVNAVVRMEPFDANDLPEIPDGAKTAVIAAASGSDTNFWVAAGVEDLGWVDTGVSADVTAEVTVEITFKDSGDALTTVWTFNGEDQFERTIAKAATLNGVAFTGNGDILDCWGDSEDLGNLATFRIVGFPVDAIAVTVTNSAGEVIELSAAEDYKYLKDETVGITYVITNGWVFTDDGASIRSESHTISNSVDNYEYVAMNGRGIRDVDIGPVDGWFVVSPSDEGDLELVGRYATLEEAMDAQKGYTCLKSGYSSTQREIVVAEDGKSITINGGDPIPVKDHYQFIPYGDTGIPGLLIADGEKRITSIAESSTDPTAMIIGTIENSVPGFSYSVLYADDLYFSVGLGATEPIPGTGKKLELLAPKGDNGKRFYCIDIFD